MKENKATQIMIADDGLKSIALTYRIKLDTKNKGQKRDILVDARSEIFLSQLKNILEYKQG